MMRKPSVNAIPGVGERKGVFGTCSACFVANQGSGDLRLRTLGWEYGDASRAPKKGNIASSL